jgi:hypothetical protein
MLLDFDPQVTVIAAQPSWLRWRDDAGRFATRQFRRPWPGASPAVPAG